MTRLTLALAAWIGLAAVTSASQTPRKETRAFAEEVTQMRAPQRLAQALEQVAARQTKSEFFVTERTEITVNGKACRYEEVPRDARIVQMELAADKKTVLKIHFRTGK